MTSRRSPPRAPRPSPYDPRDTDLGENRDNPSDTLGSQADTIDKEIQGARRQLRREPTTAMTMDVDTKPAFGTTQDQAPQITFTGKPSELGPLMFHMTLK